jgi:CheY-like chemotaxis protein
MNESVITLVKSRPAWPAVRWARGPQIRHIDNLDQIVRAMSMVSIAVASIGRIIIEERIDGTAFLDLITSLPPEFLGDVLMIAGPQQAYLSSAFGSAGQRALYTLNETRTIEQYLDVHGLREGEAAVDPPQFERLRILVAEDERKPREFLAALIQRAGCDTLTAAGGFEAVRLAQEQRPQVILLDGLLPEMHGFEVARFVRSIDPAYHPRIVLVTAVYKHSRYQTEAKLRYGVDQYLVKPVTREQIANVIFTE